MIISYLFFIGSISFFEQPIVSDPLAFPRSPEMGLSINTTHYLGEPIQYLKAKIGRNLPFVSYKLNENLKLQIGVQAGVWVTLGYKDGRFPLLTEDFYFSVPFAIRYNNYWTVIKWNHISAHLGDGFEEIAIRDQLSERERRELEAKETFANQFDVGITLIKPFNYSRDYISTIFGYEYLNTTIDTTLYFHGGYIYKTAPDLDPWQFGTGIQLSYPMNEWAPYYAQDVTWYDDVDSVDYSGQLGVEFEPDGNMFKVRFAITGYAGSDRRGQLVGRKLREIGVGVFIQ